MNSARVAETAQKHGNYSSLMINSFRGIHFTVWPKRIQRKIDIAESFVSKLVHISLRIPRGISIFQQSERNLSAQRDFSGYFDGFF